MHQTVERLAEAVSVPDRQDEDAAHQQLFLTQLPADANLWLHNLQAIGDAATKQLKLLTEAFQRLPDQDRHPAPDALLATDTALIKGMLGFRKVFWGNTGKGAELQSDKPTALSSPPTSPLPSSSIQFGLKPQPSFAKDFKLLSGDLHNK